LIDLLLLLARKQRSVHNDSKQHVCHYHFQHARAIYPVPPISYPVTARNPVMRCTSWQPRVQLRVMVVL